ncbi:MAG: PfkB family carbohydrate kinase [Candidatus Nanohaloarchaea archaeon]
MIGCHRTSSARGASTSTTSSPSPTTTSTGWRTGTTGSPRPVRPSPSTPSPTSPAGSTRRTFSAARARTRPSRRLSRASAQGILVGAVGSDESEYDVLDTLSERNVDVSAVAETAAPTGAAYVFVDPEGENRIGILPGANRTVDAAYLDRHVDRIRDGDVLLLQNEIPVGPVVSVLDRIAGDAARPTVILDPAPVSGVRPLLDHPAVDIVTPNEAEADALAAVLDSCPATVVRTHGREPVVVDDREVRVEPPAVETVDTTGAGDVFNGFLATCLGRDDPLQDAIETAATAAALSVTGEGVQQATPTMAAVRDAERS